MVLPIEPCTPSTGVSLLTGSVLQATTLGAAGTHPHGLQEGPRGPVRGRPEGALAGESQVGPGGCVHRAARGVARILCALQTAECGSEICPVNNSV